MLKKDPKFGGWTRSLNRFNQKALLLKSLTLKD